MKEIFKRQTLAQLSRFLLGIEKAMNEQYKAISKSNKECPLLALMSDHWDEFCRTFRTRGLLECGVEFNGQIKAI